MFNLMCFLNKKMLQQRLASFMMLAALCKNYPFNLTAPLFTVCKMNQNQDNQG